MLSKARFNRRLHQIAPMFQTLFESLATDCKAQNPNQLYAIDSYPVPAGDVIRISGAKLYQGEVWRGTIASKRRYFYGFKSRFDIQKDFEGTSSHGGRGNFPSLPASHENAKAYLLRLLRGWGYEEII